MDLRRASIFMRRELIRFNFPEQQKILAETLLEFSLAIGRPSVRIPRLIWFTEMTGIAKPHVSPALRALKRNRVLVITSLDDTTEYQLLPDSEHWNVDARLSMEERDRAWSDVLAHNGLSQADLWPDPTLDQSVAQVQLSAVVNNPVTYSVTVPNRQRSEPGIVVDSTTPQPPHGGVGGAMVHDSCNAEKRVHDHGTMVGTAVNNSHDVGELVRWSTDQMLALLRKVARNVEPEFVGAWRHRIETEGQAVLVMGIIREAGLRGRTLKNAAGWMNTCYLNAMKKPEDSR